MRRLLILCTCALAALVFAPGVLAGTWVVDADKTVPGVQHTVTLTAKAGASFDRGFPVIYTPDPGEPGPSPQSPEYLFQLDWQRSDWQPSIATWYGLPMYGWFGPRDPISGTSVFFVAPPAPGDYVQHLLFKSTAPERCAAGLDATGACVLHSVLVTIHVTDGTAPVVVPTVSAVAGNGGWLRSAATVSWAISDPESAFLSNGCETQVLGETSGTTLTCAATSVGGTRSVSQTVKVDATAPVVSVAGVTAGGAYLVTSLPAPTCVTTDALSGVATAATLSLAGSGIGAHSASCAGATDVAGNAAASVSVDYRLLDATPPVVVAHVSALAGNGGWLRSAATVSWEVSDPDSTVTTSGCATQVVSDTAGTTVTCTATSEGGSTTVAQTVQVDTTAPVVSVTGVTPGAAYSRTAPPAPSCATSDALSGVATAATVSTTGGTVNGVGTYTVTCTGAADAAGNAASATVQYRRVYTGVAGFLNPKAGRIGGSVSLSLSIAGSPKGGFVTSGWTTTGWRVDCTTGAALAAPGAMVTTAFKANRDTYSATASVPAGKACWKLATTLDDGTQLVSPILKR